MINENTIPFKREQGNKVAGFISQKTGNPSKIGFGANYLVKMGLRYIMLISAIDIPERHAKLCTNVKCIHFSLGSFNRVETLHNFNDLPRPIFREHAHNPLTVDVCVGAFVEVLGVDKTGLG